MIMALTRFRVKNNTNDEFSLVFSGWFGDDFYQLNVDDPAKGQTTEDLAALNRIFVKKYKFFAIKSSKTAYLTIRYKLVTEDWELEDPKGDIDLDFDRENNIVTLTVKELTS